MPDEPTPEQLAAVLRAVADANPPPWHPGEHARATGANRDALDEPFNLLRVRGFVRLTDWEPGKGQGYLITPEGRRALAKPGRRFRGQPAIATETSSPTPADETPVTRLLIAAQAAVFALGLIEALEIGKPIGEYLWSGDAPVKRQLAVFLPKVLAGQWWRLWSYALVHGGLLHLALNLYAYYLDASLAEHMWGRLRFLVLFLLAVLGGGVGAVLATPGGAAVGSSGGWCGIVAAQCVWIVTQRHRFRAADLRHWTRYFTRVAVLTAAISLVPGISWGGHLGGAIGGAIAAGLLSLTLGRNRWLRLAAWIVLAALPVALVYGVFIVGPAIVLPAPNR